MLTGRVKWFSNEKGYGFVQSGNKDYFVHYKHIIGDGFKTLLGDDQVSFVPEKGDRGMLATQVVVLARGREE